MINIEEGPCSELAYERGAANRLHQPDIARGLESNPNATYTWVVRFKDGGMYRQPVKVADVSDEEEGMYFVGLDLLGEDGEPAVDAPSFGVYEDGFYVEEGDDTVIVLHGEDGDEGIVDTGYLRISDRDRGLEGDEAAEEVDMELMLAMLNRHANNQDSEPQPQPHSSRFSLLYGILIVPIPRLGGRQG